MIGFYKHRSLDGFIWVLEVVKEKNEFEVIAFQYQADQKCPESSNACKADLNEYWEKITEAEVKHLIKNLDEQKAELAYRQSEDNLNWCKELATALKCVRSLYVQDINGVVRITERNGSEFTISRNKDGKIHGEQTGLPDR